MLAFKPSRKEEGFEQNRVAPAASGAFFFSDRHRSGEITVCFGVTRATQEGSGETAGFGMPQRARVRLHHDNVSQRLLVRGIRAAQRLARATSRQGRCCAYGRSAAGVPMTRLSMEPRGSSRSRSRQRSSCPLHRFDHLRRRLCLCWQLPHRSEAYGDHVRRGDDGHSSG